MDLQIEVKPTMQKPPTFLALAALALGLFSIPSTGCSFLGSYGPPPDYRQVESFDCTGYTLPVLDTIWAGLNGLGAAIAASSSDVDWQKKYAGASRSTTIVSGLLWVGISGVSAAYGYSKAEECTNARNEVENREYFGSPRRAPRYLPPRRPAPSPPPPRPSTDPPIEDGD
jgi:hypothetical protein